MRIGFSIMTRYEFAAGLNSCLQQIERLISPSETVVEKDIQALQRLTEEFAAELATIGTRVSRSKKSQNSLESEKSEVRSQKSE